jgi:V/A-type H+-transporting ATPase subunit F
MSDIAFIGDRDTIWPFRALGAETIFSDDSQALPRLVSKALEGDFKIIFVTEEIYGAAREEIDSLAESAIPAITVIPSVGGNRGMAMQMIRDSVRRAMGAEFI